MIFSCRFIYIYIKIKPKKIYFGTVDCTILNSSVTFTAALMMHFSQKWREISCHLQEYFETLIDILQIIN